jgi:predicted GNAT family acetyltransferase
MDVKVVDDPGMGRFEVLADGEVAGFVLYQLYRGEIVFTHTETDERFKGMGLGSRLVRDSLDAVRQRHLAVLPYCPFVKSWISAHREYADLVPEDRRAQFGL